MGACCSITPCVRTMRSSCCLKGLLNLMSPDDSTQLVKKRRPHHHHNHHNPRSGARPEPSTSSSSSSGDAFRKILLLGAAESGKTTVLKQLKMLYPTDGKASFAAEEFEFFRGAARVSALEHLVDWLRATTADAEGLSGAAHEDFCALAVALRERRKAGHAARWAPPADELLAAAARLWRDEWVAARFAVEDDTLPSAGRHYFLSNFDRILGRNFMLTHQDILNVSVPTKGITEVRLQIEGVPVHLVDVGGQREERKKWLHCFASVDAVVFVSALSEYDQVLAEDSQVNRLQESVKLFGSVVKVKWFRHAAVLLFLNKTDLFVEKVRHTPLRNYFPSYAGDSAKYDDAMSYVATLFRNEALSAVQQAAAVADAHPDAAVGKGGDPGGGVGVRQGAEGDPGGGRAFYLHYTCATNADAVASCFGTVADMLRAEQVKASGLC